MRSTSVLWITLLLLFSPGLAHDPVIARCSSNLLPSDLRSSLHILRGGGGGGGRGGVPLGSSRNTPKRPAAMTNMSNQSSTVPPVFFQTTTALQMLGYMMLSFAVPFLLTPQWLHSKLYASNLDDMALIYQRLFAMRELFIGLMSIILVHDQASESIRRSFLVLVAAILCVLQVHLVLTKTSFLVEGMSTHMLGTNCFLLLYLLLSAYLSWKNEKK
jgi:hypothetical protein